jgi:hypothetical protein
MINTGILEGKRIISEFMGYRYVEENVLYDVSDQTWKDFQPVTVYSKTPILLTERDEDGFAYLADVPNPDYGNTTNATDALWNPDLKVINWCSLNEYLIDLKYDTSWESLMSVVHKIGEIENQADSYFLEELAEFKASKEVTIFNVSIFAPILLVYECVIDFIRWYKGK